MTEYLGSDHFPCQLLPSISGCIALPSVLSQNFDWLRSVQWNNDIAKEVEEFQACLEVIYLKALLCSHFAPEKNLCVIGDVLNSSSHYIYLLSRLKAVMASLDGNWSDTDYRAFRRALWLWPLSQKVGKIFRDMVVNELNSRSPLSCHISARCWEANSSTWNIRSYIFDLSNEVRKGMKIWSGPSEVIKVNANCWAKISATISPPINETERYYASLLAACSHHPHWLKSDPTDLRNPHPISLLSMVGKLPYIQV